MATHAAFLRGINVGGHRVTNDELRGLVTGAGIRDVTTYRASGNLLLRAETSSCEQLARQIAAVLEDGLGYAVPTFVRTTEQLAAAAAHAPFPDTPPGGKVHVGFLRAPLADDDLATLRDLLFDTDRIAAHGTELHWQMATGRMMDSAMQRPEVDRLMGDRWTVRTVGTVERMAAKAAID